MIFSKKTKVSVESSDGYISICACDTPTTMDDLLSALEDIVKRVEKICNEGGVIRTPWPEHMVFARTVSGIVGRLTFIRQCPGKCHDTECPRRFICEIRAFVEEMRQVCDPKREILTFSSLPIIMDLGQSAKS